MITAIKNHILFAFFDKVKDGRFVGKSDSTIVIPSSAGQYINDESAGQARYGKVLAVGPDCDPEIKAGTVVLIEKLMWSEGFEHEDVKVWRTDDTKILAIRD